MSQYLSHQVEKLPKASEVLAVSRGCRFTLALDAGLVGRAKLCQPPVPGQVQVPAGPGAMRATAAEPAHGAKIYGKYEEQTFPYILIRKVGTYNSSQPRPNTKYDAESTTEPGTDLIIMRYLSSCEPSTRKRGTY